MCGIIGIVKFDQLSVNDSEIKQLTDFIVHRGPDGEGVYCEKNIGLGHRRLAIIDLSDDGKQPMMYDDKYVITFNGEIYNYIEIKESLEKKGYIFKTKTDTEVILAAYDYYGDDCVNEFNGMWAFVIYDKIKNILFCSRDRFGVKPFYYSFLNGKFVFSSEIKPIINMFSEIKVNKKILMDYLLINLTDHTEETFFENIKILRGSHILKLNLNDNSYEKKVYYDIKFKPEINKLTIEQSIALYQEEFDRAVGWRMRSDVKVGTCLSGGLDSSYIAAVASEKYKKESDGKFNAITAESLQPKLNETIYAKTVVDHLNLNWHVTSPTKENFEEYVYNLVKIHEEPFGTPSVFLQNKVMKASKKAGVTVLLDGQGADESLLGYPKYLGAYINSLPFLKKITFLKNISKNFSLSVPYLFKSYIYFTTFIIRKKRVLSRLGNVNKKYLKAIDFSTIKEISRSYNNVFEMQKLEIMKTQIPQLLKWEDKNSMAFSIETRLPFLDYRLVETSLSINNDYKLKNYWSKYIIRKAMENKLPESIVWRRNKIGFEAPTEDWLKESFIWDEVKKSPLLNDIFNNNVPKPSDVAYSWRLCNVALWEKVFNVKF